MTLLIRSVRVLGVERAFPEAVDVFVSGDRISALGNFPNKKADEVLDGQGCYLSPGFIDVYAECDHTLDILKNPGQEGLLKQGVTTIVAGQGGASLAPLLYGTLESVRKWADLNRVNVNWRTMEEFLGLLQKRPLGVNFATLVGHSTVRRAIVGEEIRALTKNEQRVFEQLLNRSLLEGAFGLSADLNTIHVRKASYRELKSLADVVARRGGVYATALDRGKESVAESLNEVVKLTKEAKVKTLLNDFVPVKDKAAEYAQGLETLDALPVDLQLYFTVSPHEMDLAPLYYFLPEWAQNGSLEVMNKNLEDEWLRSRILADLPRVSTKDFIVAHAVRNEALKGHSLNDLMRFYNIRDAREALLKLMTTTGLRATIFYRNIDSKLLKKVLAHRRSLVVSRFTGELPEKLTAVRAAFPTFLSKAEKENFLSLEEAVDKITRLPAELFDLKERGEIREGNFADLTGFRGGEIKFTVVNGRVAVKDGEFKTPAGRVLKHG